MDLWQYWGKQVKITFTDGQVLSGLAGSIESKADSDNGIASIDLETNDGIIAAYENEIVSIEVLN